MAPVDEDLEELARGVEAQLGLERVFLSSLPTDGRPGFLYAPALPAPNRAQGLLDEAGSARPSATPFPSRTPARGEHPRDARPLGACFDRRAKHEPGAPVRSRSARYVVASGDDHDAYLHEVARGSARAS